MKLDFFESGLCFYCDLAQRELQELADFHFLTEKLWRREDEILQEEIAGILKKYPKSSEEDIVDSYAWDLHLNQFKYPDIHRSTLVISIYVFVEDQLNGLCETLTTSMGTPLKLTDLSGQGVERACLFLTKVAGFDLSGVSGLSFVKEVNRLRNKMVHAGGVLSADSNDRLNRFVQATEGLSGDPGHRVHIHQDFITHLISELGKFFDELDIEVQRFMARLELRG
ncbi:hypothetical protein [Pseudomonas sp. 58 R 3]|uniref:hypothetical protein n=1 Tax=Pseudomonas sp. 58 R 3 TaxID=1844108 RepID=UPI00081243AB|nr:hypothetical protein [Pseudomonas sp. 58 R 3]CRM68305.1 hypothetical protein [Pseudomonas sp. 58 R 3]